MKVVVDKLSADGASERMIVELTDAMLLKLGRKYFDLASNPAVSTYVNPQIPDDPAYTTNTSSRKPLEKVQGRDFFDALRDKYSVFDFISMLRDVKEVKTYGDIPINEADITEFIHNIYVLAQMYRSDVNHG